jgi:peptide/nickel transport system substrate-binding protein
VLGIESASPWASDFDHQGLLNNPLTRQAIAACLDREKMRDVTTGGLSTPWPSFLPPGLTQLGINDQLTFDSQRGLALLEQAGWVDDDGDTETPILSLDVANVPVGTELKLSLLVSNSGLQWDLAGIIHEALSDCGIGIDVFSMPSSELYAQGPDGTLFGRRFDLALISWQPMPDLDCKYYLSPQIPDEENFWIGTNIAGLSDEGFDQSCTKAALALPDEFPDAVSSAEQNYLSLMPSIPLFSMPQVVVASSNVCFGRKFLSELDLFTSWMYFDYCH